MARNDFFMFDESLKRRVHIFEHVILMARGYVRPSFLKLLCRNDPLPEEEYHALQ